MSGVAQGETLKMARKTAEELAASSGKAVGIAVWGNRGPTMIWWVEGARPLQVNLRAGLVMPLLQSASGHLFLAFKPRASTQVLLELERGGLSDAQLDSLLDCVRTEGMASVRGNVLPDVNERSISAFSAPVFDRQADMILALTLMDYSSDFTADDAAVALLKHAAAGLSARLGYRAGAN